jgi:phosphinothricin acetyltransferase
MPTPRSATVTLSSHASPYRTRSAYRFTLADSVYVRDGFSGRGLGRLLLTELIAACSAGGWASAASGRCNQSATSSAAGSTRC